MSNQQNFKNLSLLLRDHRKKSGLSQQELAQIAGVGKTVIYDLEHGKMTVRLETLLRVLDALNIRLEFHSALLQARKESGRLQLQNGDFLKLENGGYLELNNNETSGPEEK